MNKSKSLINAPNFFPNIKFSKSLQNTKKEKQPTKQDKKDIGQNLIEDEIDVFEIKLNN